MSNVVLDVYKSRLGKKWLSRYPQDNQAEAILGRLAHRHHLPDILARILLARGVSEDQIENYLHPTLHQSCPDPLILKNMDKAAHRLAQAIQMGQKIAMLGDYDVDGTTSCALLALFLRACGQNGITYIPDRLTEGYGPNPTAMHRLVAQGATLIITLDCGSCAHHALASVAVDVIVVDHHQVGENLPPCYALVNPQQKDDRSALTMLAAVGLTFLLLIATNRCLRQAGYYTPERPEPNLMQWIDIVALGTVCDMVPLVGLNRAFVAQGLKYMQQKPLPGIEVLLQMARIPSNTRPTVYHLGFAIGPRINAGGRIGTSDIGLRLLTTPCAQERQKLAYQLDALNFERQNLEKEMLDEALLFLQGIPEESPIVIVHKVHWHAGVIGIVAARLVAHTQRPSLVIAFGEDGIGKGSGRSIPGIDLGHIIQQGIALGHLITGGGHRMAVGFTIHADKLEDFCHFLYTTLAPIFADGWDMPFMIDGLLSPRGADLTLVGLLEKAGPYGQGNPAPCFAFPNVRIIAPRMVGKGHISCFLHSDSTGARLRAIAFHAMASPLGQTLLTTNQSHHVAGHLCKNNWQERESVQMIIEDISC